MYRSHHRQQAWQDQDAGRFSHSGDLGFSRKGRDALHQVQRIPGTLLRLDAEDDALVLKGHVQVAVRPLRYRTEPPRRVGHDGRVLVVPQRRCQSVVEGTSRASVIMAQALPCRPNTVPTTIMAADLIESISAALHYIDPRFTAGYR